MRSLAFTIWMNDQVILNLWISYYSRYFDQLFIICNGTKDKYLPYLNDLTQKYNLGYERLEEFAGDSARTLEAVKPRQIEFLKEYDWVLYCDCDELLITNPQKFKDLRDLMNRYKKDYIHCIAYDVVQHEGETQIDYSKPYFSQRSYWVKNPNYNKILLSKVPLNWNEGFHQIGEFPGDVSKGFTKKGLYLVHLKHSDLQATNRDFGPTRTSPEGFVMSAIENDQSSIPDFIKII